MRNHLKPVRRQRQLALQNIDTQPVNGSVKAQPRNAALPTISFSHHHKNWFSRGRKDLPILGKAQGGNDGNIVMEEGAIDWTSRPTALDGIDDAFAVYVTGDSMVPKYQAGDLVYIHPHKAPRKGRFVLIEMAGHKGLIKQFEKWDGDTLVAQQFNPAKELRFNRSEVLKVMLIIGSMDA